MSETSQPESSEEHMQTQEHETVSDEQEPELFFEDIYDEQNENNKQDDNAVTTPMETIEFVLESAVPLTKEEQEVPLTKEEQEVPSTKEEQEVPSTKEEQEVPLTKEEQEVPLTKEEQEVPSTKEEQEVPSTKEEPEVPSTKEEPKVPSTKEEQSIVPSIIFIVPYRDREKHQKMFASIMKEKMKYSEPYKIYYVHQTDSRGFNRGAMKNIGFLAVKSMYPNDYKNITLVFNDIDTMPNKTTILNYKTSRGNIKHFYGFDYTLGGIVSILAGDFEQLNGFPNFWAWGYEDNMLQSRAKTNGFVIDRSVFYKIQDPNIIHLTDTPIRTVNRSEFERFLQNTSEGIHSIQDLNYVVNEETGFIDVLWFNTTANELVEKRVDYDLRNGPAPFKDATTRRRVPRMRMLF